MELADDLQVYLFLLFVSMYLILLYEENTNLEDMAKGGKMLRLETYMQNRKKNVEA